METLLAIAIVFFFMGWFMCVRYHEARQRRIKLEQKRNILAAKLTENDQDDDVKSI